ncbi:MAG: hypothetical protein ACRD2W_13240 [Acidimicrobiales bacterium]
MTVTEPLLAALSWEPQIKGALYVVLAVLILCGSCYMILATDVGARLGFLLAGAGLFGWLATMGFIWWGYGRGPVGPSPSWESKGVVAGELAGSGNSILRGFPENWREIELADKAVADAVPAADGILAPSDGGGLFKAPADYVLEKVYRKGGDRQGPFGVLNFRPFNVFHTPHFMVLQVRPAIQVTPPEGGPPRAAPDPNARPVGVVLVRNLGALRLHPAVFTIATTLAFALFCYQLHVRDKEAWARREEETESGKLQPVPR